MSIEPPSFSTDLPPPPASDGKNEEKVQLPFCSDDIVIDLRTSGGDSPNCIPKELESELDTSSIIDLDTKPPQVYNYPTPPNPFLLPRRPPASFEDDREKSEAVIDEMPPCFNQNDNADIDLRNTQIPGITCRISIVVNEPSDSG